MIPRVRVLVLFAVLIMTASTAAAQDDPHAACAAAPTYIPLELLQRPVPLRQGIGNSHEKVTTASAEGQAFYDQGLNYLESYVWIEASRSFHQALRHDPKLAMAYIGLSRTHSGLDDTAGAKHFLEMAKELGGGASEWERRRIDIREKQLAAMDDLADATKFLAYKKSIDDALAKDFADPELWLLRGNAEESNASGRGQRGGASSVAFYEHVLRLVPDHASAHHYLVHTYETIGQIDKALEHGERYAALSPAIPHAAHMWGHDLRRVGRVDDAIARFQYVDKIERAYYKVEKLDPALDWHHAHNLDLLAGCYQHKGQMKQAERIMRESATLRAFDAYRAFNMKELPSFLIHQRRYREALVAARKLTSMDYAQARCVGHALAGLAELGLGRPEPAESHLEAARRELEQVPRVTPGVIPRRAALEPWVDGLRGELLLRQGKSEEARAVLTEVVKGLRATPGPDAWTQALFRLETIGRSAREAGDWDLAAFVASQMLEHDSAYGGSHLAQALVLQHAGDADGSRRESAAARSYWRSADPGFLELDVITNATHGR